MSSGKRWLALLLVAAAIGWPRTLAAQDAVTATEARAFGLDQEAALRLSQGVIGQFPSDYTMLDRAGHPVRLAQYRGKPLLVNFVYSGCFKVCPTSSRALRKAVDAMRDRFGVDQFQVLSIGFNQPEDTPLALRTFAAQQRIDDPNWELVSPRVGDVQALADDFGFSYVATPLGFDHTLQVSIIDASGRIHAQVYGDAFAADSLGEPLRQLLTGSLAAAPVSFADLIDKVRILCSVYDPVTGKYRVNYAMYIEIAGGITFILFMIAFVINEWRARRALRMRAG